MTDGRAHWPKRLAGWLRQRRTAAGPLAYRVERDELITECTRSEIEQRELAVDPMGAVPEVPFGHLNEAWLRFLSRLRPDDAIWSFTSQRVANSGLEEWRTGYVAVRRGSPGHSMVAALRVVPADHPQPEAGDRAVSVEARFGADASERLEALVGPLRRARESAAGLDRPVMSRTSAPPGSDDRLRNTDKQQVRHEANGPVAVE